MRADNTVISIALKNQVKSTANLTGSIRLARRCQTDHGDPLAAEQLTIVGGRNKTYFLSLKNVTAAQRAII